jgi:hypothetical protein
MNREMLIGSNLFQTSVVHIVQDAKADRRSTIRMPHHAPLPFFFFLPPSVEGTGS